MAKITFVKGQGGLNRRLPGEDHISAILFYSGELPEGFTTDDNIKEVNQLLDAEDLGILSDAATTTPGTAATGTVTITSLGADDDHYDFRIFSPLTALGNYIKSSAETTIAQMAAAAAQSINDNTISHGYTAVASGNDVDLISPEGVLFNGYVFDMMKAGNVLDTANLAGGTDAVQTPILEIQIMHYHVMEFYRINPGAKLFIAIYDEPVGALAFTEIPTIQHFSEGKIRNMGIFTKKTFSKSQMTLIQGQLEILETENKPISTVLLAADISSVSTSSLSTLANLVAPKVSFILGQDGANVGADLFADAGYSITAMGAALGTVSKAKVSECIGWVEKFPMNSVELDVPALANGVLIKTLSQTIVDLIGEQKRYIILVKYDSDGQVYWNDSHTAVALDSDYAYIENNRTMDKAIRGVRAKLLPKLNGPVLIDPQSGKLSNDYVIHLEETGNAALEQMERDGELSGYKTFIDPDQDVASTSTVEVAIVNVPIGVSRRFNVKISFASKI